MLSEYLRKRVLGATDLPREDHLVVCSPGKEERSRVTSNWRRVLRITKFDRSTVSFQIENDSRKVRLRDSDQLAQVLASGTGERLYLDVTGIPHFVWAPLLRGALRATDKLSVVYVEPQEYRRNPNPIDAGDFFDLSERVEGVEPIPGFAVLKKSRPENEVFIPMLGFEGGRVRFLDREFGGDGRAVAPIVPLPGYRVEYPTLTYLCNREFIRATNSWSSIKYVAANDSVEAAFTLKRLAREYEGKFLRVALTGTKPHAVGAVLYALAFPSDLELIYDYPISRSESAQGVSAAVVFDLDGFLDELRAP